jgi:hypothetical protein
MAFVITAEYSFWLAVTGVILLFIANKVAREKDKELTIKKKNEMNTTMSNTKDFKSTKQFTSTDVNTMISLDDNSKKLCFIKRGLQPEIFEYRDILQSEIIEDGESITRTSRGSQLGGALIGGILAGGVGAIIGGLSGSQQTSSEVKKIQLQIVVNDTKNPIRLITFLNEDILIKKSDGIYKNAHGEVTQWHKLISVLIKQADDEDKKREIEDNKVFQKELHNNHNLTSNADELLKLSELLKQGILTQEEFNIQKQKILSS